MKKVYEKPEVEYLDFMLNEDIADNGGEIPGLSGDEGFEEW